MCMSTAAIGSSSAQMRGGTSSSAAIVIVGTRDHDRVARHLRERGGGMAGANVRGLAERIELQRY